MAASGRCGVLDSTPARGPAHGIRTSPDVRTDTDVAAATLDAARVSYVCPGGHCMCSSHMTVVT